MRRNLIYFLLVTGLGVSITLFLPGQEKPTDRAPSANAPTSGYRAEFLEDVAYYEQRYTRLAAAMPAEKYSWRPAEGVRSVGEVYTHIISANYGVARALGTPPPAGFDPKAIPALSGDKAKVLPVLKESFAHFRTAILALSDADADKPQKMFNRETTLRGSLMMIDRHWGEHLGQSIAYARVNGVVPPWTEESQQQQQKSADKPKP
jgi:uncharacterized damage-inducible protein DinB